MEELGVGVGMVVGVGVGVGVGVRLRVGVRVRVGWRGEGPSDAISCTTTCAVCRHRVGAPTADEAE